METQKEFLNRTLGCLLGGIWATALSWLLWGITPTDAFLVPTYCYPVAGAAGALAAVLAAGLRSRRHPPNTGYVIPTILGLCLGLGVALRLGNTSYLTTEPVVIGILAGGVVEPFTAPGNPPIGYRLRAAVGSLAGLVGTLGVVLLIYLIFAGPGDMAMMFGWLFDPLMWDSVAGSAVIWLLLSLGMTVSSAVGASVAERIHTRVRRIREEHWGNLLLGIGMLLASVALVIVTTMYMIDNRRLTVERLQENAPLLAGSLQRAEEGGFALSLSNDGTRSLIVMNVRAIVVPLLLPADGEQILPFFVDTSGVLHSWRRGEVPVLEGWALLPCAASGAAEFNVREHSRMDVRFDGLSSEVSKAYEKLKSWETTNCQGATHSGAKLECSMIRVMVFLTVLKSQRGAASKVKPSELYFAEEYEGTLCEPQAFRRLGSEFRDYPWGGMF